MFKDTTKSFIEYLNSKGIKCVENFEADKENLFKVDKIKNQIYAIVEFHMKMFGYTGEMNRRLNNNIGNIPEQYKIYIKKLTEYLKKLRESRQKDEFKQQLYENGITCLDRANKCIDTIYRNDYLGLIIRSTDRIEVCLGNTYYNNLRRDNGIQIKSVDRCCYNLVETDLCHFLGKIKRTGIYVNFESLIDDFCNMESLDKRSFKFISALLSYPGYCMKYYNKHIINQEKFYSEEECLNDLKKAIKKDGYSLI